MVLQVDAVSRASQKLDETCHLLALSKMCKSPLKEELLWLSQSFKVLAPRISAAGFYDINRNVLLGLVSVVTTYFIVFLQFRN